MSAELRQSPEVHELAVVLRERWVRYLFLKPVVASVLRRVSPATDVGWSIVEVRRGSEVVAKRGFVTAREAAEARRRFVTVASCLADAEVEQADWQRLLDELDVTTAQRQ